MAARRPVLVVALLAYLRVAGTGIERRNIPMPKFGGRTRLISVGGVILAGLVAVVGVVIFANPAGAHTATLSGTAACADNGTVTITYTLNLQRSNYTADVTITGSAPTGTTITPDGLNDVPGNNTYSLTQTGVPADAGIASLDVHVIWSDEFPADATSGPVNLPTNCAKPPTKVTAAEATFADATCLHPTLTYTIPTSEGVQYQVNGTNVEAKTYDATPGDVITITAVALKGYELTGTTSWGPHTFGPVPTNCTDTPTNTQPSCTSPNGTYTIPGKADVVYYVNGTRTDKGTYTGKAGTTITVTARGPQGETLPGTAEWTLTFGAAPTDCSVHVPTFVDNTCTLSGTYTIPDTFADFTVNGVAVSAGTHSATAGAVVTVKAIARAGHPLTGTTSWTHTFPTLPQCAPAAANNGSGPLANTGPEVPVGQASLIAVLLALVGGAMLFAGRRRPATTGRHSVS